MRRREKVGEEYNAYSVFEEKMRRREEVRYTMLTQCLRRR